MSRSSLRNPLWLVLASLLCLAGTWTYVQRVLIAYQISDAAAHDRPRGNLSDLYPRWLGTREFFLRGQNPYSPDVTREIQIGYYGRALDPSRSGDPKDQQAFAYPAYVIFYLAPTVRSPFPVVQRIFFWVLLTLTITSLPLWLLVLRWPLSWWEQLGASAFLLASFPVMQGLKLQQITLFVAALLASAIVLLVSGRAAGAGILIALATIKPQLAVGLLVWMAIWTVGNWKQRYRWILAFVLTMGALIGAAELCLPRWIPQFLQALRQYSIYTGAVPLLDELLPRPFSRLVIFAVMISALYVCWRNRKAEPDSETFVVTTALAVGSTLLIIPSFALYNQVLLLPAMLFLVRNRRAICTRGLAPRLLLISVAILLAWQWLSSTVLAILSFVLPSVVVQKAWALPSWTSLTLPVAVTALILLLAHRASFGVSPDPIPS